MVDSVDQPPASEAVVEAVAAAADVAPSELTPPLYSVVDPDALDNLCRSFDSDGRVSFTYLGYDVTVRGDGEVSIRE